MDTLLLNPRTARKQPTGVQIKNLVSKMLTICSLFFLDAGPSGSAPQNARDSSRFRYEGAIVKPSFSIIFYMLCLIARHNLYIVGYDREHIRY